MVDHVAVIVENVEYAIVFFGVLGFSFQRGVDYDWGTVRFLSDNMGFTLQLTCLKQGNKLNQDGHICFLVPDPVTTANIIKNCSDISIEILEVNDGNLMIEVPGIGILIELKKG